MYYSNNIAFLCVHMCVCNSNRCGSHGVNILLEIGSCGGSHRSQKGGHNVCVCVHMCVHVPAQRHLHVGVW